MIPLPSFEDFFCAIWNRKPFPWQSMLAERVAAGDWPKVLDLPTASGKTACIDIAIYALAAQFDQPTSKRTAARRIWFVVDRRIVVDAAYDRGVRLSQVLLDASCGPARAIADRLRSIAGTNMPLAAARLRGGIFRDDGWARLPSQPAVITSTVDQVGSRLLFRGYGGSSRLAAPIFAGLAANDSLILLDEAHCSVPFLQTLEAIDIYRGERWSENPLGTPFAFVALSATPPGSFNPQSVFPGDDRERALDHPELRARLDASKRALLTEVKTSANQGFDPLIGEVCKQVEQYLQQGKRRIAVIVNRVVTATSIARQLRIFANGGEVDVGLMTGRMRSFERDRVVETWSPYLRASEPDSWSKPIVLVATQCIEVGADFSFDSLVCEAASLDALRQRFGRLDRMGLAKQSNAVIVARDTDIDPEDSEGDFVYGGALSRTWHLLKEHAYENTIDFGVEALRVTLEGVTDPSPYLAPTADAPMLLPSHLDILCQTSVKTYPEPDVGLFLHGTHQSGPEAQVVLRADLIPGHTRGWTEIVALCPPVSAEQFPVPLYRLRAFLRSESDGSQEISDVEGRDPQGEGSIVDTIRSAVVWRGRDKSRVIIRESEILPNDIVVIPTAYGIDGLGESAPYEVLGSARLDIWEPAIASVGRRRAVRLNRDVLAPWLKCAPLSSLLTLVEAPFDRQAVRDAIDEVLDYSPEEAESELTAPPAWWLDNLRAVRSGRIEQHPSGGVVLFARAAMAKKLGSELDMFADDDDLTSVADEAMPLEDHCTAVKRVVEKLADKCLSVDFQLALAHAAFWHDVGKLDGRFQILLHNGDECGAAAAEVPLAKSSRIPVSPDRRKIIREASGLPTSFRHEMLSAQIVQEFVFNCDDWIVTDLVLHLIASHHGYARPFAPVSIDSRPPSISGRHGGIEIVLSEEDRESHPASHRFDSGHAERFWRLVRRHGWWGLSYLEAILRLGDWYASELNLGLPAESAVEA